jgi:hypothetical protein
MDLQRMLASCQRDQWKVDDLDWSVAPRPMARDEELRVVQYFTDMAAIERLAKELFVEQRRRTDDPTLAKIFSTFVADEERHAIAAERLAAHYDVHQYRRYQVNPALTAFAPPFIAAIRHFSAEIANAYVTTGELLLDVALLRSIDDYVDDEMSRQVMRLINRDESRHIAIDYHMVEYYASPAYRHWLAAQPRRALRSQARAWAAFAGVLWYAGPFLRGVFVEPMAVADPSGRRIREAFKRAQLLSAKPEVAERPFTRFITTVRRIYNDVPGAKAVLGGALSRLAGVPRDLMGDLHTADEFARAARMSYDELAREALDAKHRD